VPTPTSEASSSTTATSLVTTTINVGDATARDPDTLDPFGEGGENDQLVANILDRDPATEWLTERYLDPLPLLKAGVGVTVRVNGRPTGLEIIGLTEGTAFEVYWSNQLGDDLSSWERIAGAHASPATTSVDLPPRRDGYWLIWLTDLPSRADGTYQAAIAELRFSP
jgi:hypothetical protein